MKFFSEFFLQSLLDEWSQKLSTVECFHVENVLSKECLSFDDFLCLIAPISDNLLEIQAQKSHKKTVQYFGRTIRMFSPIYVSNACYNQCVYCSFTKTNRIPRKTLSEKDFERELSFLLDQGFQNILILSGEDIREVPLSYFEKLLKIMETACSYKALEVYPMDSYGYQRMKDCGVDGIVVFQETYNKEVYRSIHLSGPKRLFEKRLDVPDLIARSNIAHIGMGCLLGLSDWRLDIASLAFHVHSLLQTYQNIEVSISVPRIRKGPNGFVPKYVVSDRDLVQIITALRLFLPECGIVLSTRESATLRDSLMSLGITQMSAGSVTNPGGYDSDKESLKQFDICDTRSVAECISAIQKKNYDPVWKDWESVL